MRILFPAAFAALALAWGLFPALGSAAGSGAPLKIVAAVNADEPLGLLLSASEEALAERVDRRVQLTFLERSMAPKAAARLALSEPDGLTLGFLALDAVVTLSLGGLAPYLPEDFWPTLLSFSETPVLIGPANSAFANDWGLPRPAGEPIVLVALGKETPDQPTLAALAFFRQEKIPVSLSFRAPPYAENAAEGGAIQGAARLYFDSLRLFSTLRPTEAMAVPFPALAYLRENKFPFRTLGYLTRNPDPRETASFPGRILPAEDAPFHPLMGFFFSGETSERTAENTPAALYDVFSQAALDPESPYRGYLKEPLAQGEEARQIFAARVDAQKSLLAAYGLYADEEEE
ncbi:MAG: hypothetical protein LBO66_01505 [Deltaproteobacteria bacterium]|jgi:hypothetical protein|nr:hypothetical protein [Deltaproteobacteria bacterium]